MIEIGGIFLFYGFLEMLLIFSIYLKVWKIFETLQNNLKFSSLTFIFFNPTFLYYLQFFIIFLNPHKFALEMPEQPEPVER